MKRLDPSAARRVLIIKPSSPGDILHALPVARGLRRGLPRIHLAWLVATPFADLLEPEPSLDEVIRFDRKHFARLGRSLTVARDFLDFVLDLRHRRFDLVLDLQGLFRSGFLAWSCGAPLRIGFRAAREAAWVFYTHRVSAPAELHALQRNLRLLDPLGIAGDAADTRPAITAADSQAAAALLAESGLESTTGFIVLAASTRWETKRWPAERFGQLAARLHAETGLTSLLVGGADDVPEARQAEAAGGGAAVNLAGRTRLRELAAVISAARLVVTADSMPMHLAAALGRPLVALFGPTHPGRTGPYGRAGDVLRLDLACSPCYVRRRADCPYELRCMNELSVEAVLRAALARLDAKGAPAATALILNSGTAS